MAAMDRPAFGLTGLEKMLVLLPAAGAAFLGLLLLLAPGFMAGATGYPGNDIYIYRLAGAATIGYAVALVLGVLANDWAGLRLPIVATLVFSLASVFARIAEIADSHPQLIVYAILVVSALFAGLTGALLYARSDAPSLSPDIARWVVWLFSIATVLAIVFGLIPLLVPVDFGRAFGLAATDTLAYRQAGAACLGYGIMGIFMLRSRNWLECRWAIVMAATFNGLAFLSSLVAIYSGEGLLLAYLVAVASLAITIGQTAAFIRQGR